MRHEGWVNNHHAFANLLKKFYCFLYIHTQKETRNIFYYTFLLFLFSSFFAVAAFLFSFSHQQYKHLWRKNLIFMTSKSLSFSFHTISCFHNKKNPHFVNFFFVILNWNFVKLLNFDVVGLFIKFVVLEF